MLRVILPIFLLSAVRADAGEISPTELQARLHEVAARVMPSCVAVRTPGPERWSSGVLIDREGWIVTSHHGVKGADQAQVWFPMDLEPRPARVIKVDAAHDLAILAIAPENLPEAVAFHRGTLAAGDWVIAIGYPGGLETHAEPSLRLGRVSDAAKLITTCRLSAGDSGGPLLTLEGRLAGIHRAADADFTTHVPAALLRALGL